MKYININGKIIEEAQAAVPADNGAFRYGYGLFETLLVRNGSICLGESHMQRLFTGMKTLLLDVPVLMTPDWLVGQVLKTVKKNKLEALCRVRLQVYAGGGGIFGQQVAEPGFIIECFPLTEEVISFNENGLVLGIAEGLSKSIDSLSNLKTCNALAYAMAARQAKANKWNDALVCNTQGNIIESAIANIFWLKEGHVFTPPLSEGCIAGVMRGCIVSQLGNVTEKELTRTELSGADEVFLTNAVKRIKWVRSIGNTNYTYSAAKAIYHHCFASDMY